MRTWLIKGVITAEMKWWGPHLDRLIAIEGALQSVLKRITNGASGPSISNPTDAIYPKRPTVDRFIVIVDRFDHTVTPIICIKLGVLPMF